MSRRNNNQNPFNFTYNAFLKIQTRDHDKYYHFYFHDRGTNNFSIEVKPSTERRNLEFPRPADYQSNARFYCKPDVTFEERIRLITRKTLRILARHRLNAERDVNEIYYVEDLKRFLDDEEMFEHDPDFFAHA